MRRHGNLRYCLAALSCALLFVPPQGLAVAQDAAQAAGESLSLLPPEQLESLVAPIALYPDPLLAQVLVASTYPLELMQLQQWLAKQPELEGDALADAVAEQPWDASIQSMAAVPEALDRLANDIQWTTELGNAFLAQQGDVMDAVQSMRTKAQDNGALEPNEQQTVETVVVEKKTVIVVESADPEVIYVPSYSPTVVYPPPIYPYPPIYYPPYPAGAAFVTFSIGVMWGAAWGGACCGCGWGGNDIHIDIDNNFNRVNNGDRGGGNWQHDPGHRGGTPYPDRTTADKYGGSARGDSPSSRQTNAGRQQAGSRPSGPSGPSAGSMDRSATAGAGRPTSGAGTDKIGNRNIPSSSPSSSRSAFGGQPSGFNGSTARAQSSRGASSMGARGGGGRRR